MGKVDLLGVVCADLRAVKMAVTSVDAHAIKGLLA
jgi:hypothetical protein